MLGLTPVHNPLPNPPTQPVVIQYAIKHVCTFRSLHCFDTIGLAEGHLACRTTSNYYQLVFFLEGGPDPTWTDSRKECQLNKN